MPKPTTPLTHNFEHAFAPIAPAAVTKSSSTQMPRAVQQHNASAFMPAQQRSSGGTSNINNDSLDTLTEANVHVCVV